MLCIADIMTEGVRTATLDDSLQTVRNRLEEWHIHHLPVIDDDGRLAGIISDRDVLQALSPYIGTMSERSSDRASLNKRAHQIMSRAPSTIKPEYPVAVAVGMLLDSGFSCLVVVDHTDALVGIVTWRDIMKAAMPCFGGEAGPYAPDADQNDAAADAA